MQNVAFENRNFATKIALLFELASGISAENLSIIAK